jgi:hypothetical protein
VALSLGNQLKKDNGFFSLHQGAWVLHQSDPSALSCRNGDGAMQPFGPWRYLYVLQMLCICAGGLFM